MVDRDRTPEAARRLPEFTPHLPFLLASSNEWFFGEGVGEALGASDAEDFVRAERRLLDTASDSAPVVIGALPFAHDGQPQLYRPLRWTRTLPDLSILRSAFPHGVAPGPTKWSLSPEPTREGYRRSVSAALDEIARSEGLLRKVVLARSLVLRANAPIVISDIVSRLLTDRSVATFVVPMPACSTGGRRALVGATPELLLSRRGNVVRSRPLAGSSRRELDPTEDAHTANTLLRSEKDLREHATVIEWIADRLSPFCKQLHVPASPSLVSTATMWHLASDIHGQLADADTTSLELARALHPTPAVCGMPFERAADLIARLESFDRRYYTGAVGWCDRSGDGDWYVAIRCADICGHVAHLYAGAGIVSGSTPENEAAETAAKFSALLNAIDPGHLNQLLDAEAL